MFLILTIGDFNAKATNWHKSNKTTYEGLKINAFASQFGLQQLINELTHLTGNSSSCIAFIFTY